MAIIGVVGQNGSGKDEVVKYLKQQYGVPFLSSGDIVRDIAAQRHIEGTRENLSRISAELFALHGKGYFMKQIAAKIKEYGWRNAGVSGIRAPEDVAALKAAFGRDFFLIGVTVTDPAERYRRMSRRGEARDALSVNEFQAQDASEERLFRVSETMQLADASLKNDGTLADFHGAVEKLLKSRQLLK